MKPDPDITTLLLDRIRPLIRAEVKQELADALRVDEFLPIKDAAKLVHVSPSKIRRWLDSGKLKRYGETSTFKSGKKRARVLRVSRIELERLIKTGAAKNDELSPEQLAEQRFG